MEELLERCGLARYIPTFRAEEIDLEVRRGVARERGEWLALSSFHMLPLASCGIRNLRDDLVQEF